VEQLALAQQIELLQAQQNQLAATHQQYVNMGMLPQGQIQNYQQIPGQMNAPPQGNQFQFPGQMAGNPNQNLGMQMNPPPTQNTHRRNQSALPGVGQMVPPPAPSSNQGTS
jgi:protein SSD1